MDALPHFCSDQKVVQWLREVFQEEGIPSFDKSPEFAEALKKIISENEAAERDARSIIKAETKLKDFYNEKAQDLQLVTDFMQLNSETCRRVEDLASLGEKMKLKEPNLTNFLLAMTEIEDKESVETEKKFVTSHHMAVFSKKTKETMKMNEKLRRYQKSIEKVVEMQKSHYSTLIKELDYFKKKKGDVIHAINKSKESLKEAGYDEVDKHIDHSVLVEKAQELKDLEEQLKTLRNKLQVYHTLTPNLEETVRTIEAKEQELLKLEDELQMLLQLFENS